MTSFTRRELGAMAALSLGGALAGCIGDDGDDDPANGTDDGPDEPPEGYEEPVATWWADSTADIDAAFDLLESGDAAVENGELEDAMDEYEDAFRAFQDLVRAVNAEIEATDPEDDPEALIDLWILVGDYFFAYVDVAITRYDAVYETVVEEDPDGGEAYRQESDAHVSDAAAIADELEVIIGGHDGVVIRQLT